MSDGEIDRLGVVDDRVLDEDRRPRPQRQRNGIARPRVDGHRVAVERQVDERVEGVLLQVADDDLLHRRLEVRDDVAQQIVRHRPRRGDVLDLQRDGVGLEDPHPDRQDLLAVLVAQDDDRHVRDRVDHQSLDRHLDLHDVYNLGPSRGAVNSSVRLPPHAVRARPLDADTSPARPIHSAGPGRFTTTFWVVRPESSVSRRRLAASTSTSTSAPTSASFSSV